MCLDKPAHSNLFFTLSINQISRASEREKRVKRPRNQDSM